MTLLLNRFVVNEGLLLFLLYWHIDYDQCFAVLFVDAHTLNGAAVPINCKCMHVHCPLSVSVLSSLCQPYIC